jgi:endoglycosylceramidase
MNAPRLPLAALAVLCAACGQAPASPAPPAPPPGYHVSGGFLRVPDGRALVLRGANLSGAHKHAPYFDFHTPPDYQRLSGPWGMNAIRFLITWAAVEPQKGMIDTGYLDEVKKRMDWAKGAGLRVVLDMHQDVYGEGFEGGGGDGAPRWSCDESHYTSFVPNPSQWFLNYLNPDVTACYDHFWQTDEIRQHYVEAWRQVAAHLSGYDDTILGFDPMNEPYWGSNGITTFEANVLQQFYEDVVAAVRKERPRWVAFLEPASSRNLGIPTGLTPFSFADVVYAPHSYDRDAESGKGFDPTHRDAVIQNIADLQGEARNLGAALWIGEYGGNPADPGIAGYMDAQYDGLASVSGGSTYWHYGEDGGYGMLAADGSEKKDLLDVLVRPWAREVAGDPVSSTFDEATSTFTLRYRPDTKVKAPTVIVVPDRVYPAGYQVSCGGCKSERGAGVLQVLSPPAGKEATVTISP